MRDHKDRHLEDHRWSADHSLRNPALEYAITRVQEDRIGLKLNGKHQLQVYIDDVHMLGENLPTVGENAEIFINASKDIDLEVNSEKN